MSIISMIRAQIKSLEIVMSALNFRDMIMNNTLRTKLCLDPRYSAPAILVYESISSV